MSILYFKTLGSWLSLDMVNYYVQLVIVDLIETHQEYSSVDNLSWHT